jgi:hypothetical protein
MLARLSKPLALLAALLLASAGMSAPAADLPKSGKYSGKFGWYSVGKAFEIEKDHVFWAGEFSGAFFNDGGGGFFHNAAVQCPGMNDITPDGNAFAHGYCIVTDKDGDKAYLSWKCKGKFGDKCNGDFQWTGGTGKYTGIKGANKFYGVVLVPTSSGYSGWEGSWELP